MPHFHVRIRERHRLLLLLLAGLLISVLFLGNAGNDLQGLAKTGGETFMGNLTASLGERTSLSVHVLWSRAWLPALWILLSFTAWGAIPLYLLWVCLGFAAGSLLWTVVTVGGWRGPFYFWGLIFPQYLLYVPALLLFYVACLRWNSFWRERGRHLRISLFDPQVRLFILRNFLGILLYGLGIWTEITVNPWILRKIFIIS